MVQYDILEILNFVGVYSNNCGTNIRHKLFLLKTIAVSNIKILSVSKSKEFKVSVLLFEDVKPVMYLKRKLLYIQWYGWLAKNKLL